MAKYADYVVRTTDGIDEEIVDAQAQQQARQDDSTPEVDWEQRYKELEKFNSRQAQQLGEYRKTIDSYILNQNPTSVEPVNAEKNNTPSEPLTFDSLVEDPQAAIFKAVDNHPVVQEARELTVNMKKKAAEAALEKFTANHPDFREIDSSPEFQNWVVEDSTRMDLYQRADHFDLNAADALFRLYKAEKGLRQSNEQKAIAQAELVSSSGEMPASQPKYSRSEYIHKLTRAKQGDLDAEAWVRANAAGYRKALERGDVRD